MASLAELEKLAYPIIGRNFELRKLDRIDGLLFISMIEEGKSWSLIGFIFRLGGKGIQGKRHTSRVRKAYGRVKGL
jgi:hypothetical protein